ncbi:MAG: four helix bundle protein [Deltaproteobacteria bacterium]|nr:four helix bundle protein [Deltaproteobacteria bacterium]
MNRFEALEVAMQLVEAMPKVIEQVARHDKNMATQMKDALGSIAANLGEGSLRRGKDRGYHYSVAAGSAEELAVWVRIARAWRHVDEQSYAGVAEFLDRTNAICYRLVNPRP